MLKNIQKSAHLLIVLSSLMLSACGGGGGDTPDSSKVLQESQLYHPVTNPAGAVEQPGQTAVLGLESEGSDLPPPSDASQKGVENLWFEVKDSRSVEFALDADTLASIARVEIRDAGNILLATLSATTLSTVLELGKGRYQALVVASAAATAPVPVFAQYRAASSETAQVQAVQAPGRVQAQAQYTINVTNTSRPSNMYFMYQCVQCNLQGHSLVAWKMSGRDFHGSSFNAASLVGTQFTMSELADTNFTSAWLTNANFQGANLVGAKFTGATLTGANFTGANLIGAEFSRAILTGANFTGAILTRAKFSGAILTNAIWVDGLRRCAPGSMGVCF